MKASLTSAVRVDHGYRRLPCQGEKVTRIWLLSLHAAVWWQCLYAFAHSAGVLASTEIKSAFYVNSTILCNCPPSRI